MLLLLSSHQSPAQTNQRLPSPEKVVAAHIKSIGGKKNVSAVPSATYEWKVSTTGKADSKARWQIKAPAYVRTETTINGNVLVAAANASSAWTESNGLAKTLTGAEAATAKLRAVLDAGRLIDYKKQNVFAKTVSIADSSGEPAYVIEFSHRGGARLTYWFSVKNRRLLKIVDDGAKTTTRFDDYRREGSIQEPHRISISKEGTELVLELQSVTHNIPLADAIFDAPKGDSSIDVVELLRTVGRNQDEVEKRVNEYSFMQKETQRELSSRGELKKETVKLYEVFPIANREPVMKLVSENGVPLSAERAAKEEKRVNEEFEKTERDKDKDQAKADRRKEERKKKVSKGQEDDDPEISQFLKVCEFVSPRRERFRDRDAVVFDFRPQAGFKPQNRAESLIAKLVGVVWIDPVDRQVIRLEARLAEGFKMGGGLLLSVKPGAAVVMEQTRMVEGVWLPNFAQINVSVKVLLFGGTDINQTVEWSGYKHFSGRVEDYKIETPKAPEPEKKP